MKIYSTLLFSIFISSAFIVSCNKDTNQTRAELQLDCIDQKMGEMTAILDTSIVGDVDGTYPKEEAINLEKALVDLQLGKSMAMADKFVLQYEIDNYCIAADKAIASFNNSLQITLPAGTLAELQVMGIDRKGRIEFGEDAAYGGGSAFTVETWMKYNSGFFESGIGDLIATFNNVAVPFEGWMINFMGDNLRATIGMGPQPARVLEFGSKYPTNYGEWNHIAMVYDESLAEGQLKIYLNGKQFFSKTNDILDNAGVLQKYQPNKEMLAMWAFQEPTDLSRCMTGYIKKFRMWNTAKSMEKVNELMTSDVAGTETDLVCAWDFLAVPVNPENIPDKTGRHSAKLVGKYKWYKVDSK